MVWWSKPNANVFKVNCKWVFKRAEMKADVACVMRNNIGQWVGGNARTMGLLVPLAAELWSIFYGLKMAWEKGDVRSVIIYSDYQEAVNLVNNPDYNFCLADLVTMINNLKNEEWESCVVMHVSESNNQVAAALANYYINGSGGLIELPYAPTFLSSTLAADRNGL